MDTGKERAGAAWGGSAAGRTGQGYRREHGGKREGKRRGKRRLFILAGALLAALAVLAGCAAADPRAMKEGSGHFQRQDALPELSEEGIKCAITEAYYTNDGGLFLKLKLSNGTEADRRLLTLVVTLKNERDEGFAVAPTAQIDGAFYGPAGGYGDMSFFISSEYLSKTDDDLDSLTYEIRTTSQAVEGETTAAEQTQAEDGLAG